MLALGPKMGGYNAHDRLSKVCIAVSEGKGKLIDLLSQDSEVSKIFDRSTLEKLLDPVNYLGNSGVMVDKVVGKCK